jgi:hypothetical protein
VIQKAANSASYLLAVVFNIEEKGEEDRGGIKCD